MTLPEIQRSSLTGAVLHLKSLSLPGLDVLHFEFLDPPPQEALADALRQLFLLDAIDADGDVTPLGRKMAGEQVWVSVVCVPSSTVPFFIGLRGSLNMQSV